MPLYKLYACISSAHFLSESHSTIYLYYHERYHMTFEKRGTQQDMKRLYCPLAHIAVEKFK